MISKCSIVQPTVAVEAERIVSSIDGNGDWAPRRDRHLQRLRAAGRDVHPTLGIHLLVQQNWHGGGQDISVWILYYVFLETQYFEASE